MKKALIILLCFCTYIISSAEEKISYGKINSKRDQIIGIEEEISKLEKKIQELNSLKKSIDEADFNIDKKIESPKITLVLSGGGSKGAAHVGVLRVLEKYQIPIDYIVGCSAGSIVGGLYAAGYSPDEIEEYLFSLDYNELLSNNPNRAYVDVADKISKTNESFTLLIDEKNKISLPQGLINGEDIYLSFKEKFKNFEHIENFDNLPIKYRAVVTNIATRKAELLDSGDLSKSILASMALPPVFSFVEINGNFYTDGGIDANLPILEALRLTPDNIIIAVDITANSPTITKTTDMVTVLNKLVSFDSFQKGRQEEKFADILIVPNIKEYSGFNFEHFYSMIKEGEKAAEFFSKNLKNLSSPSQFKEYKERAKSFSKIGYPITHIEVIGNNYTSFNSITHLKPDKEILTIEDINLWISRIQTIDTIDRIFYEISDETITFTVSDSRKFNFSTGFEYLDENYGGALTFFSNLPFDTKEGPKYSVRGEISSFSKLALDSDYKFPIKNKDLLFNYNIFYNSEPIFYYGKEELISTSISEGFGVGMEFGYPITDNTFVGGALKYQRYREVFKSGFDDEIFKEFGFNWGTSDNKYKNHLLSEVYLYRDTLNSRYFPSKGSYSFITAFSGITDDSDFNGYKFNLFKAFPITSKLSISSFLTGGLIVNDSNEDYIKNYFNIGGSRKFNLKYNSFDFYGLPYASILSDEVLIGGVNLQYNISPKIYLTAKYNGITYDSKDLFYQANSKFGEDYHNGFGVGIGLDTFTGPIEISLARSILKSDLLFKISFGYTF